MERVVVAVPHVEVVDRELRFPVELVPNPLLSEFLVRLSDDGRPFVRCLASGFVCVVLLIGQVSV
nr:hypothetical protein [Halogeometricum sp. CBA1124]